jgi:hypothetical protein
MRFYDLDIDVKNYAKRIVDAGYKCPADINSVSDFVKGLKILNIWGDVIFWPLRANQNAGTGTTVYNLGTMGIYNGTLTNGPIWQANGIFLADATTQHIATNYLPEINEDANIFSVVECNGDGAQFNVICSTRNGSTGGFTFAQKWNVGNNFIGITWVSSGTWSDNTQTGFSNGSFHSANLRLTYNTSPKTKSISVDGNSEASPTSDSSSTSLIGVPLVIGSEGTSSSRALSGQIAFLAYFRRRNINANVLHSLYRSTLGKGLALP